MVNSDRENWPKDICIALGFATCLIKLFAKN